MIAQALELDRLVLGALDENEPGILNVSAAWQDGEFLELSQIELHDLPDAAVAEGNTLLHPSALAQLVPSVAEHLDRDFEAYAGIPLQRADGTIIGLVGGYAREPITGPDLVRSLLSAFATHAASAIDRRRANEEIRANQDRFEVLAHQSQEMLVEIDHERRVAYVSQASLPVLGYRPEELVGRDMDCLSHPDDRDLNQGLRDQLVNRLDHAFFVMRVLHADGGWRWLESRTSAFTAPDGTNRALVLSRDVTDQRRQELGRDLLYRVVQQGADFLFVCDPDSTLLTYANEAATRRLEASIGTSRPDDRSALPDPSDQTPIEGRYFYELLPPEEAIRLRSQILPELMPSQPWSGELHLLGISNSDPTPTEATIFLFQTDEETQRTYLGITLRDIEARRTAEEALRQSELRLSQAQKMEAVGRLAGGIAHDFNNLLTAILGYGDLVLDELGDGHRAQPDVEEILHAADRASGLTRQLLAFSRRQVLQPESVDLNAIVADIDRMMRRLIGENIELVTIQDGELCPIVADPGQIEQVIVNLVVNAQDAMPRGGRLEVETANYRTDVEQRTDSGILPAGEYVLLSVSDSGMGMDEETRAQIFEPFFTTKEAQDGTGLGLASAYGIVKQSGGQIDVDTRPGDGTRFTIFFPATQVQGLVPALAGRARVHGGHETILLVEDANPLRRLVQRTLEEAGYQVLSAESAIRVLFMSGFTEDALVKHGFDPQHSKLLEKPFKPAVVLDRVRALLDATNDPGEPAGTHVTLD